MSPGKLPSLRYIKAAASPKEVVILLDTSGSMTGLRKEIAKHVVLNILETLGQDDFVAIYTFAREPLPLVPCFTTDEGILLFSKCYVILIQCIPDIMLIDLITEILREDLIKVTIF